MNSKVPWNCCVFDVSTLRASFGKPNRLADHEWLKLIFKKIIEIIITQSKRGDRIDLIKIGDVVECDIADSPVSLKNKPCHVLSQAFNGATLMLKTEPVSDSLILFLGGYPEINCGTLNGEVGKIFPEALRITRCDSATPWC